ncbi:MAG: hypothetical protein CL807_00740 [Citromicrobium sp.]|nr:hypothetical protein [Citromicrobium sp.]MAO97051.1 hypothetical protein [Citromicrobium sp.]MBD75430.1 hypothetical protein [Citromicrobium sp.]MBT46124.1 hypothetical protein [Citromicrobium sp.]|tara:strand:+ start:11617 stop:12333 length:717 start_codon:yes stop_codon:yes gene_type:complete
MADDETPAAEGSETSTTYKSENTDANGDYKVGKNRPPKHGQFAKGDGRPRGRRRKGTKNLATDFQEELSTKVSLKVDGKPRRVTKQRAIMMRLMDNASRGQNTAINTIMAYADKFGIEVQLEMPDASKPMTFPHMDTLTLYEMELLELLLDKASGVPMRPDKSDKLYEPDHPLAYLEDPDDARNYDFEQTAGGVIWKRYNGHRFADYVSGVLNTAYASCALPESIALSDPESETRDED